MSTISRVDPAVPLSAVRRAGLEDRVDAAIAVLREAATLRPAAFSCGFGAEDMVVLDLIRREALPIEIFTLDTGRLPEETYRLMQKVEQLYGRCVTVIHPDPQRLQALVAEQGVNGFFEGLAQRRECCAARKLEPLARALAGHAAWVTGMRAQQSSARAGLSPREYDEVHRLTRFQPLADWIEPDLWDYLRTWEVPYHELYDRFFPSIGCAPCTRAITRGEDRSSARWWWEPVEARDSGLRATRVFRRIVPVAPEEI